MLTINFEIIEYDPITINFPLPQNSHTNTTVLYKSEMTLLITPTKLTLLTKSKHSTTSRIVCTYKECRAKVGECHNQ